MKNFIDNTKSTEENYCSDETKRTIIKAGLEPYTESELCLYLECLIEVINEKKEQRNGISSSKENN